MERPHTVGDQEHDVMMLPPGFRFHPTDEEIITHYLTEKVINGRFTAVAIGEVDLNKCEPWDLPKRAKMGEREWFFFCHRDKKYPTGMRTNRATESGYWKATGKDKEIYKGEGNLIGMKKTLVFYKGRAPKGEKTNWVMHEYRLEGKFSYCNFPKSSRNDWVVCRIVHKNTTSLRKLQVTNLARKDSFVDNLLDSPSLPALMDLPNTSDETHDYSSFTNEEQEFKPPPSMKPIDENFSFNNSWTQMPQDNKFINNYHHQASTSNSTPNSNFYPQISHQHSNFNQESSSFCSKGMDYQINSTQSNQCDGGMQQYYNCKVEQFSSNNSLVTVSQDTGVSTDVGPEISSMITKPPTHNTNGDRSFEDLLNCFLK